MRDRGSYTSCSVYHERHKFSVLIELSSEKGSQSHWGCHRGRSGAHAVGDLSHKWRAQANPQTSGEFSTIPRASRIPCVPIPRIFASASLISGPAVPQPPSNDSTVVKNQHKHSNNEDHFSKQLPGVLNVKKKGRTRKKRAQL